MANPPISNHFQSNPLHWVAELTLLVAVPVLGANVLAAVALLVSGDIGCTTGLVTGSPRLDTTSEGIGSITLVLAGTTTRIGRSAK